jgi:uncharacterized membrane protein
MGNSIKLLPVLLVMMLVTATTASAAAGGTFAASPTSVSAGSTTTFALTFTSTQGSATGDNKDNTRCFEVTLTGFSSLTGLRVATTENRSWTISASGNTITATAVNPLADQLHRGKTLVIHATAAAPASAGNRTWNGSVYGGADCETGESIFSSVVSVVTLPASHSYTAIGSPASPAPGSTTTFTLALKNAATSTERAQKVKIALPPGFGFVSLTSATPSGQTCGQNSNPWVADGTLYANGRINLKSGSDLCPGGTLTVVFKATVPTTPGTYTWVTDMSRTGAAYVLTGDQPKVEVCSAPAIVCPANITVNKDPGACSAVVTFATPAATGTPAPNVVCSPASGSTFPVGTTTVLCTATNSCGSVTCSFTVTVRDTQPPVVTCPANVTARTRDDGVGNCSTHVAVGTATFSDDCPGGSVRGTRGDGLALTDPYPKGVTSIEWIATDASGNVSAPCTQTVTVVDDEEPGITAPAALTVGTDPGACVATGVALGSPVASDNCPGVTFANNAPASFPKGITTVTWTATDAAGNTATATQRVTVADHEKPVISAPGALTVGTDPGACIATGVALGSPIASDNCPGVTVANDAPASFPKGTTTVTWSATDAAGNTATATQLVIVEDYEDPVISAPPALTVGTDPGACVATGVARCSASDNCPGVRVTNDAPAHFPKGTTTVTWSAIDAAGNSATAIQLVTVEDYEDPVISAPPALTVGTDPGTCVATGVALGSPVASDNCSGVTVSNDAPATFPKGITTVTWTAIDGAGNAASATQLVTVEDREDPVIYAPGTLTFETDPGACVATGVALGSPIASDNCPGVRVSNDAPAGFPGGTTTVTWSATDAAGNTDSATQLVIVEDHENPVISAPLALTVGTDPGACVATHVALGSPVVSDNCPGFTVANDAPASFLKGTTTTVTWTVTDAAGNTATGTQLVTVADRENPVISAPPAVTVGTDPGTCLATGVALGSPVASDNCPGVTVANDAPASFAKGTTTVTWSATDAAGNTATATQVVTVEDHEKPVISAPLALTVGTDAGVCVATGVALGSPVASDNCPGVTFTNDAPASFPKGTTTVTWSATDAAGNSATATQLVTVEDREKPAISAPLAVTVSTAPGTCRATGVALGSPIASDNCPGVTFVNDAPAIFPGGITTVTWSATDASGNSATATQLVTVEDHERPVISAPGALTFSTDPGACVATGVALGSPVASDNCPGVTVANDAPTALPKGITTVTWRATDAAGNTATATQLVTVEDHEDPIIWAPGTLTVDTDPGASVATGVALGSPIAWDNCPGVTFASDAPASFPRGTTTVTWTATDAAGHTDTANQFVIVEDREKPVISAPPALTVSTDTGACVASGVALGSPAASDNCPGVAVANNAPASFPKGTTTVTWSATDAAGNTATATQLVTVEDRQRPVISAPVALTVGTDPGACLATGVALGSPIASDNCPGVTVANDAPASFPKGITTVTWTATDAAGNTATATQLVTVADHENPVIWAPSSRTVNTDAGASVATGVALGSPIASDNCPGVTVANNAPAGFPKGTTTVTWTATDAAGNIATANQLVTVEDHENPVISAPLARTVNTDPGACVATGVALGSPVASDNCPGVTVSNNAPASFPKGTTTVTWTATDASGNTATATQLVTVADHERPVIYAPGARTAITAPGTCVASAVVLGNPIASDNCPGVTAANNAPASFTRGITTVTWTATDAAGNTATAIQLVTVEDHERPAIWAPAALTVNTDRGACVATGVALGSPVVSDNCPGATVANNAPASFAKGTTTVTWTATDASGNTATATQLVTVEDHENPVLSVPLALTVGTDPGACVATGVALGSPVASDNCPGVTVSNNAPSSFPKGAATTVTWTATDAAGNTATATQLVTVQDHENPTISAPHALTVGTDPGACVATGVALGSPVATDNCPGVTVSNNAPASFPKGTTTVTWSATDAAGNTATATQVVIVEDYQDPVISAPLAVTVGADPGTCVATGVALGSPVASDNCSGVTVSNDAPASFPRGTTTVTWSAIDGAGNAATATQLVTVEDREKPVITAPLARSANTDPGACVASAVALGSPVASDNCPGVTVSNNAPASFPKGTTTVIWTATDAAGNTATATQLVTVADHERPVIYAPGTRTANTDPGVCVATGVSLGSPLASDNCPGVTVSNNAPASFPKGTTTVTWTATDAAGNTASATQLVIVRDQEKPSVVAPAKVTTYTGPGGAQCGTLVSDLLIGAATASDNCPGMSVARSGVPGGNFFPVGSTTITYTATDASGNTAVATQIVQVIDNTPPVVACPANVVKVCEPGQSTAVATFSPSVTDNCPGATVALSPPSGYVFPLGVTTVSCTATDAAGNASSCSFTVTVRSNSAPVAAITAPASGAIVPIHTTVSFTGAFIDDAGDTHAAQWTFGPTHLPGAVNDATGSVTGSSTFTTPGVYNLKLTVTDQNGAVGTATTPGGPEAVLVVYDPSAGFVAGGGWIDSPAGAYPASPALAGKASFGFVSKYARGTTAGGETEFRLEVADLDFYSTRYDWVAISGAKVQYRGSGTINGAGDYGFLLSAIDGQIRGDGVDRFRIKITDKTTGAVVYDNQMGAADTTSAATPLEGGTIEIQSNSGGKSATSVGASGPAGETNAALPIAFGLSQNVPNPFRGSTQLRFDLPVRSQVRLTIYDISGRETATLANGEFEAGRHQVMWSGVSRSGRGAQAGIYFIRMEARSVAGSAGFSSLRKMILVR